jgi:hypothetical protein
VHFFSIGCSTGTAAEFEAEVLVEALKTSKGLGTILRKRRYSNQNI